MTTSDLALQLWPPAASATAVETDWLILAFTVLTLLLTVPVFVAITWFAIRYREGVRADRSSSGVRSMPIEISWMLIPFLLTLIFFAWGARLFFISKSPPADAMVVEAIGRQWMWKFQHPTGQSEINDLHIPVGQAIRIRMTSQDVIHALYFPVLRMQMAVLPDRTTEMWFKADRTGTYRMYCSEYCGTDHSRMDGRLVIMTQAEYAAWLQDSGAQQGGQAGAGRAVYEAYGCGNCHDPGARVRAPSLAGLYGRPVALADGRTVVADESYLRQKILNPNRDRLAGGGRQVMPAFQGVIANDDLDRLVAYIKATGPRAEQEDPR
ncbi:cytochrome c oxidase subunit II [Methylobacterium oryzihabitans]|uniref:cytochrome-c oxidase n=1 Tax=Methylobacterium oryzihabitans TaxID=2499852 RepID=A0A437P0K8_9HYPH|nr:cytochrome c oxidase subunit II [Methylobacterium oryzihabitans]RVU15814.1 cytochrome c oxidase subunit II [Methylobacterium oryzihabitans]